VTRNPFSHLLRTVYGRKFKDGTQDLFQGLTKKFLLAVAQAISPYCISAFILPTTLSEEIECVMNSFYWGYKELNKLVKMRQDGS
jgi:hypothetical protein